MEWRRHKDIIAIRTEGGQPAVAFHARNLTVAEISDEAWGLLPTTSVASTQVTEIQDSPTENFRDAWTEFESWNQYDDPETLSDGNDFGIRSLTLNVTQICNLHCTYCAAGGDGTYGDPVKRVSIEKTLPQIRYFLDQIPPGQSFHIAFLGGEPLLYPEAVRAIGEYTLTEAKARGIRASFKVTTNGTLIDDKALAALIAVRAHVIVSLDGPREINDLQRVTKSGRGSFDQAFSGLRRLIENRDQLASVGVHAVFNEKNLDVEKAWDFFVNLGVSSMDFTYTVSKPDHEATRIYNENLARVARKAWNRGGEGELLRIGNFRAIFRRLDARRRLENHCGIGKNMLVVDSRNRLWTCPWTVGQKGEQVGEGTNLDYDRLEKHRRSLVESNRCGDCWARFLCGGGCSFVHSSTGGDILDKKTDFCERTRFLASLALVYYHRARTAEAG